MISHSKKFIFIHIPKTAGNSIQTVLAPYCDDFVRFREVKHGHIVNNGPDQDMDVMNKRLNTFKHSKLQHYYTHLREKLDDYFVFTSIRNPYDWIVSCAAFSAYDIGLRELNTEYDSPMSYITVNGKVRLDGYIRFESLQEDFKNICKKIDIPWKVLPHKNKSEHNPYVEYYNQGKRNSVKKKYGDVLKYFGYKF